MEPLLPITTRCSQEVRNVVSELIIQERNNGSIGKEILSSSSRMTVGQEVILSIALM